MLARIHAGHLIAPSSYLGFDVGHLLTHRARTSTKPGPMRYRPLVSLSPFLLFAIWSVLGFVQIIPAISKWTPPTWFQWLDAVHAPIMLFPANLDIGQLFIWIFLGGGFVSAKVAKAYGYLLYNVIVNALLAICGLSASIYLLYHPPANSLVSDEETTPLLARELDAEKPAL